MSNHQFTLPKLVTPTVTRYRKPKENIPQTPQERTRILQWVRNYVAEFQPIPPLSFADLKVHADKLLESFQLNSLYRDYVAVLINNEVWREHLAAVPYERRLLLLPKCLRVESKCPAPFDEFGLLCKQCGLCTIQDFQNEAEKLGYAVLVAEGSAIVMSLIQTGKIEAIVGVSCLSVLERAFPYMEAAAIPGVAVPLLQDDCIDTTVDLDWVWDYIHLTSDDKTRRMDLGALREEVDGWFEPALIDEIMGQADGETEKVAREWLCRAGKRWRPFLTVATYQAMRDDPGGALPKDIRKIAAAVECFHKASLIHDDIEDNDASRYGEQTLHEQWGIPVALNIGDLLIGEGYRLLAESGASPEARARMLEVAAQGQRELCRGQGAELFWTREPAPLSSRDVLAIFRQKTAPAFEVALLLGAMFAGRQDEVQDTLASYSEALGVAYQIRDDISDFGAQGETDDVAAMRPNILLSVAWEKAKGEQKEIFQSIWRREWPSGLELSEVERMYSELKVLDRANVLLETYKEEAIRSLKDLENPNLKGLLRRVIGKIFNDTQIEGWCKEFEKKNQDTTDESKPDDRLATVTAATA